MPLIERPAFCRSCLLLGTGLLLIAGAVIAQDYSAGPTVSASVSWEALATLAVGVIASLVGAYARGLSGRVGRVETKIDAINTQLLSDHLDKREVEAAIKAALSPSAVRVSHLQAAVDALHRRLDDANFPPRRGPITGQHPAFAPDDGA
jgi:hypothetical protein